MQVAKGRGKSVEEIRKLAGGRIWSGSDAFKNGLVDELGGIQDAIQLAKKEAGLPLDVLPQRPPLADLTFHFSYQ